MSNPKLNNMNAKYYLSNNKTISEIVDSLSLEELNELWNIFKRKNPKSIIEELKTNLKICQK